MAKEECVCGNLVDDFTSREVEALSNLRLGGYTKEDHEVLMARLNSVSELVGISLSTAEYAIEAEPTEGK